MLKRVWRKGNLPSLLVGMKIVQPQWRTEWKFLKKLKAELLYDPAVLLQGIWRKPYFEKINDPSAH